MKITSIASKTKNISAAVTTILFMLFVLLISALTINRNRDMLFSPLSKTSTEEQSSVETETEDSIKQRLALAFDEQIAGFDEFLEIYGISQRILGTSVYEDAGYLYLIRDSENFLHLHSTRANAAPYADAVIELSKTLEGEGIPFLYLQAPAKEIDGYTDYPIGISYQSTNNSKDMLTRLIQGGVKTLTLSSLLEQAEVPQSEWFYKTDHHWTTQSAFAAFSQILPYLCEEYGMEIDLSVADRNHWNALYQPQSFLGSIGRRLGVEISGLDDYTYLEPSFETSYQVYFPPESTEIPYWKGSFHHTLVRDSLLYSEDVTANRYASYFQYDYGQLLIDNMLAENGIRIAIVKDSFALPFTAFLSTAVSHIDMIDLREFDGSVTEHLIRTAPDLVIMLYTNSSFSPVMYQFHD